MTSLSLPHIELFINQQLLLHEDVCAALAKADALAQLAVAATDSFSEQPEEHQHNYLWALSDLLAETKQLHQKVLDNWYAQFQSK